MKKLEIGIIAILLLSVTFVQAQAVTKEEKDNQRFISYIDYSQTRLKNFCSRDKLIAESYNRRVCRTDEECKMFLARRWRDLCNIRTGSINDFNSRVVFSDMKEYLKLHKLQKLSFGRSQQTTNITVETTVEPASTTTVDSLSLSVNKRTRRMMD